jgi:hypothetical protein
MRGHALRVGHIIATLDAVARIIARTGRRADCAARDTANNGAARIADSCAETGTDRRAEKRTRRFVAIGAVDLTGDGLMGVCLAGRVILREIGLGFALWGHHGNRRAIWLFRASSQQHGGGHCEETRSQFDHDSNSLFPQRFGALYWGRTPPMPVLIRNSPKIGGRDLNPA